MTLYTADESTDIGEATTEQAEASDAAGPEGIITIDEDGTVIPASQHDFARRFRAATLRRVYVAH